MFKKKKKIISPELRIKIEYGVCPCCDELSPLLFLHKNFYKCSLCGEEIEQYINGVIKYVPITSNKNIEIITEN